MMGGKPRGNIPGSDCGGGAEVSSTRRQSPWVNLRRSLRVGAWNILSQREDDHLSVIILAQAFEHRYCSTLRFGDGIVARSWQVVTPTTRLVALMVTMPKELL